MTKLVLVEERGNLGVMTLNRPQKLNALNLDMILDLRKAYESWSSRTDIKCIVLKANTKVNLLLDPFLLP